MVKEEITEKKVHKGALPRLHWYKIVSVCEAVNANETEKKEVGQIFGTTSPIRELEQITFDDKSGDFVIWYTIEFLKTTPKGSDKKEVGVWIKSINQ